MLTLEQKLLNLAQKCIV